MKAYIKNVDWADEGDIFFYSVESESILEAMKDLIKIYMDLDLFDNDIEMYWGTNEYFTFGPEDFIKFIDSAELITQEELQVFDKFNVYGFDIFGQIFDSLQELMFVGNYYSGYTISYKLSQEDLNRIKPIYIKLFGQKLWDKIQSSFDNR